VRVVLLYYHFFFWVNFLSLSLFACLVALLDDCDSIPLALSLPLSLSPPLPLCVCVVYFFFMPMRFLAFKETDSFNCKSHVAAVGYLFMSFSFSFLPFCPLIYCFLPARSPAPQQLCRCRLYQKQKNL